MEQNYSFVYFSYGSKILHSRTLLSVFSVLNHYTLLGRDKILIFTDDKAFYQPFFHQIPFIEYCILTAEDIKTMKGNDDLIHRVKIGIIEKSTQLYPENTIFYLDSDTFLIKNITPILAQISSEVAFMHTFEDKFIEMGTAFERSVPNFSEMQQIYIERMFGKPVIVQNEEMLIKHSDFASWNAGLIGLHKDHFKYLPIVYELTDQWYERMRHHACEQFAFSYVLETKTELKTAENYCYHYWDGVQKKIADEFLAKKLNDDFQKLSLENKLKQIKQMCDYLYKIFPTHEYTHRHNAMTAFQEQKYAKGYKEILLTLLKNPLQKIDFFKDVAYYTKKMLVG